MRYDPLGLYDEARANIVSLVRGLSAEQLATRVPATPKWMVRDVVAHLAGVAADTRDGKLDSAPSDAWTDAHIVARRGRSVAQLLAEWSDAAPAVHAILSGERPFLPFAVDVITHEHDIRGAIDRVDAAPTGAVLFGISVYSIGVKRSLIGRGLPALRLMATDTDVDRSIGEGAPGATVRATAHELFRALAGRRSVQQVRGYDWDGDPAAYVDVLCVFGPLPTQDVREASALTLNT